MTDPYKLPWEDQLSRPGAAAIPDNQKQYYWLAEQVNTLRDAFNALVDGSLVKWQTGSESPFVWYPDESGEPVLYWSDEDTATRAGEQPGTGSVWVDVLSTVNSAITALQTLTTAHTSDIATNAAAIAANVTALAGKEATGVAATLVAALEAELRGGAVLETLQSLRDDVDAVTAILDADDPAYDTAQERIDAIKQLISDFNGLAIADVTGLQAVLDAKADAAATAATLADHEARIAAEEAEVSSLDLPAITAAKSLTLVCDPVIYIPALHDSDPAWPDRCQHTSWYQDDGEAPPVWMIFAETSLITICDGTDSSAATWRTHDLTGFTVTSIKARGGKIIVGTTTGVIVLDYAADSLDAELKYSTSTTPAIVNDSVNAVDITVLPNAPIDIATGLPEITVGVFTNGGYTQLGWDGVNSSAVWDLTFSASSQIHHGAFDSFGKMWFSNGTDAATQNNLRRWAILTADLPMQTRTGAASSEVQIDVPDYVRGLVAETDVYVATASGLSTFSNDGVTRSDTTTTYATGKMVGDASCLLCDTDDTDLVGATLIEDSFDADVSAWTNNSSGSGSMSWDPAGYMSLDGVNTNNRAYATRSFSTVVGQTYVVEYEHITGPQVAIYTGPSANNSAYGSNISTTVGVHAFTFIAGSTTTFLELNTTAPAKVDNISVKLAHPDRSVNNRGLIINGTIPAAPVATGAELVAYGPFGIGIYFEQPYNADLDLAEGSIYGWAKISTLRSFNYIFRRDTTAGDAARYGMYFNVDGTLSAFFNDGSTSRSITGSVASPIDKWVFVVLVHTAAESFLYVGGQLDASSSTAIGSLDNTDAVLRIGRAWTTTPASHFQGVLTDWRYSATAFTAEQIAAIYAAEAPLFRDNAACTLSGSSDAVQAMAYNPQKRELPVGTDESLSVFGGPGLLTRIDESAEAVTALAACDIYRHVEN